ncbi:MAG: ABC transporter permease [Methanomicrobiales archaeon]|nr:ABC transporter permease [Methanomicrobiales archaeon]
MSYLIYIAEFGLIAIFFLWFRDIRLFLTTRLPGYRKAAYQGVLFTALASLGFSIALYGADAEIIGLGLILAGLYLQGRIQKEKIFTDESTMERFFGSCRCNKDKDSGKK